MVKVEVEFDRVTPNSDIESVELTGLGERLSDRVPAAVSQAHVAMGRHKIIFSFDGVARTGLSQAFLNTLVLDMESNLDVAHMRTEELPGRGP